jgi:digeranylgeranylglycerophospholipid reductase
MNSRVESLFIEGGKVEGVEVTQNGRNQIEKAKVVLDAEGVTARLLRGTNLVGPRREMLVNGIEAEVENVRDTQVDTVDVYIGSTYAPGFFGWLMPKKDGTAKVGLAARARDPRRLLHKLMTKHPIASLKLSNSRVSHTMIHTLSLGGEIQKTYSSGLLVVGDAASQVKPTTGGGVVFGMTCAAIAAKVAHDSVRQNDVSSRFLSVYQKRCKDAVGLDLRIMGRMRKALNMMSDKKMDNFIATCAKFGFERTLEKIDDIDLQGRSLFHIIFNPRVLTTIGYFSLSCVLGNA